MSYDWRKVNHTLDRRCCEIGENDKVMVSVSIKIIGVCGDKKGKKLSSVKAKFEEVESGRRLGEWARCPGSSIQVMWCPVTEGCDNTSPSNYSDESCSERSEDCSQRSERKSHRKSQRSGSRSKKSGSWHEASRHDESHHSDRSGSCHDSKKSDDCSDNRSGSCRDSKKSDDCSDNRSGSCRDSKKSDDCSDNRSGSGREQSCSEDLDSYPRRACNCGSCNEPREGCLYYQAY